MTTRKARTRMTALIVTVAAGLTTLGGAVTGSAVAGAAVPAAVATAPSGSYTARSPQPYNSPITFFVSANRKQLQDISQPYLYMNCTSAPTAWAPFVMPAVALAANGSFSRTTTQQGVYSRGSNANFAATYTYTFSGTVHQANRFGAAGGAGHIRLTLVYTDSAKHTCTSGLLAWKATRDVQPAQTAALPPVGSYSAPSPQPYNSPITFFVSANRKQLQDISQPYLYMSCAPGSTIWAPFVMPAVALAANGSFSRTTTQQGVYSTGSNSTFPATYTYTFTGNFHSVGANGAARAAGTLRLSVVYTDSAKHSCTSNTLPWAAKRDVQLAQTAGRPPAGTYTAPSPQPYNSPITFSVSGNQAQLQNIAQPYLYMTCTSGPTIYQQFAIASLPLAADGSFGGTTSSTGLVSGHAATFTYTLSGHFHSVGADGAARAAGLIRLTAVYSDSAQHSCSSNLLPWAAKRTGA